MIFCFHSRDHLATITDVTVTYWSGCLAVVAQPLSRSIPIE